LFHLLFQWKKLEDNPITKLLFRRCGFIPVGMAANKSGESNDYDRSSFKTLLKLSKQAFEEGFDVALLPEGQLNPTPEKGLMPVFSGAYTFSKMSRRPVKMMAIYGTHHLWHADDSIGMTVTGRDVLVRVYPGARRFSGPPEFVETFTHVVGHFGATGEDLPSEELNDWLDGSRWERLTSAEDSSKKEEEQQKAPSGAD
jgi:1-acyl-sn-glycerol-3-phosphate acyltransferase